MIFLHPNLMNCLTPFPSKQCAEFVLIFFEFLGVFRGLWGFLGNGKNSRYNYLETLFHYWRSFWKNVKNPADCLRQAESFLLIPCETLFFWQTFEIKLRKNGIWLTVNRLGLPAPLWFLFNCVLKFLLLFYGAINFKKNYSSTLWYPGDWWNLK